MLRNSTKHDENNDDADDDDNEDESDNDGDDDDNESWHRTISVLTSRNISIICN
jgi:hypothetical protein